MFSSGVSRKERNGEQPMDFGVPYFQTKEDDH
jgi:hypothetical protein